jgi:D-sedoheptulose 7-phosphate isomerase
MKTATRQHLTDLLARVPALASCGETIEQGFELWAQTYRRDGKALLCGNGGSAADCDHIVGELMKGFMLRRPLPAEHQEAIEKANPASSEYFIQNLQAALPAISLSSHGALMTAFINDVKADMVFAQQVYGLGRAGDIVIGISTSGNSSNVLNALCLAKALGLTTLGLSGQSGGRMKEVCDCVIRVPASSTPLVQELHLPVYHTLCLMLEEEFFGNQV